MILVDANLLVYARASNMPQHEIARRWLEARLSGTDPIGLPWPSLLAFVRLISNPRMFEHPTGIVEAWAIVEGWLGRDVVWIPGATGRHAAILAVCLSARDIQANDVPDAHLAALAIEHDLTLATTDRGFARFPGLRVLNPLA